MTRELCPIAFIRCRAAGGIFSAPLCPLELTITHIAAGMMRQRRREPPELPPAGCATLHHIACEVVDVQRRVLEKIPINLSIDFYL